MLVKGYLISESVIEGAKLFVDRMINSNGYVTSKELALHISNSIPKDAIEFSYVSLRDPARKILARMRDEGRVKLIMDKWVWPETDKLPSAEKDPKWAGKLVSIDYTNHRGERRIRAIWPFGTRFGATEWHNEPQWLLKARDMNDGVDKEFAMKDIHSWTPID